MTLNGVFHDGSEGDGLVGALPEMLDMGDQFHRVLTEADTELLRSVRMVVHWCWGEWFDSGGDDHQHQQEQEQGSASDGTSVGFSGMGWRGELL